MVLPFDSITIFFPLTTPDILDLGLVIEPKSAGTSVVCSGFPIFGEKLSSILFLNIKGKVIMKISRSRKMNI